MALGRAPSFGWPNIPMPTPSRPGDPKPGSAPCVRWCALRVWDVFGLLKCIRCEVAQLQKTLFVLNVVQQQQVASVCLVISTCFWELFPESWPNYSWKRQPEVTKRDSSRDSTTQLNQKEAWQKCINLQRTPLKMTHNYDYNVNITKIHHKNLQRTPLNTTYIFNTTK